MPKNYYNYYYYCKCNNEKQLPINKVLGTFKRLKKNIKKSWKKVGLKKVGGKKKVGKIYIFDFEWF